MPTEAPQRIVSLAWPSWQRSLLASTIVATVAFGAWVAQRTVLPRDGQLLPKLRIEGRPIEEGQSAERAAESAAQSALSQQLVLIAQGTPIPVTPEELGVRIDTAALARDLYEKGRTGDFFRRLEESLTAKRGQLPDVALPLEVPVEPLAARLQALKDDRDTHPRAARYEFATGHASAHMPGRYLDVYAAADAVAKAIRERKTQVDLPMFEVVPKASTSVVSQIRADQVVSTFETRFAFAGKQAGRAQNVKRAAEQMDGVVLLPGDVVSFNEQVGPRSIDNGFALAPEIYKGELRDGVGGGTCQVAGTLHAAAFLGGVDIVERSNHSRPSGYIRMGLDATVVYPTVDLRLRNPYAYPLIVHASVDQGKLTMELRGSRREVTVSFDTQVLATATFKRRVDEVPGIPEGKAVLKQHGILGYSIRKTRIIHRNGQRDKIEVSMDTYPPTAEIYQVAPGADVDNLLPPLSEEDAIAAR